MKSKVILILLAGVLCTYSFSQDPAVPREAISHEVYQEQPTDEQGMNLFASEELLEMTLTFDIREFIRTKSRSKYQDATLTVNESENDSITQQIRLKARGEMRCSYCSFPPIMLKFKEGDPGVEKIQGKGTLKLVTHCYEAPKSESNVLKEYLVYKLFNLVTPYSFKTRLVRIHYKDIHKPKRNYTAYGFLIENPDSMALRNNALVLDKPHVTQNHMNPGDMARVALFNYMIGNTDWSVTNQHNVKILKTLDVNSHKGIPVVYDFDYSGFVNTGYSAPCKELPIKNVTERYYVGLCLGEEELNPVIDEFEGLKGKFIGTISNFEYISPGSRNQLESYLNSFYKGLRNQNILISQLNRTCRLY